MNFLRKPFPYRRYHITFILAALNILVFLVQYFFGYALITSFLALNVVNVSHGAYWQFFTYMFAHRNIRHLLFNMIALCLFGSQVEREMGSFEFLLFYVAAGVFAGVFSFLSYLVTGSYGVFLIGASGAVFAVQLAFAVLRPNAVLYFWGIIPIKASVMVLGATAIELFAAIVGDSSGVSHLTHLAGFAVGWVYFLVRFGINPWRYLWKRRLR